MKKFLLPLIAFAIYIAAYLVLLQSVNGAEYIQHGTFGTGNFPAPAVGSFYNSNGTNHGTSGKWRINHDNSDALFTADGFRKATFSQEAPYSTSINAVVAVSPAYSYMTWPTNTIDLVSPTNPIAPGGANAATNTLIDLCGLLGPSTIMQSGGTFTPGTVYTLTIVSEADITDDGQGAYGYALHLMSNSLKSLITPRQVRVPGLFCSATNVLSGGSGSGHWSTNGAVLTHSLVCQTNYWSTNRWTFTADNTTWLLYIAGMGQHRNLLLRSVSITD